MKKTISSLLFLFLFICAANAQSKKLPVELINRTWNKTVTIRDGNRVDYSITFKHDSTFQLTNRTTKFSVTMKLKFEKDKIIFPPGSGCNESSSYKFIIKGNELEFKPDGEDCNVRNETLAGGAWKTSVKIKK